MPYHDPTKPLVNYWFSFSDGFVADSFIDLISEDNVQRLARERGSCIVYTHFGSRRFSDGNGLNPQFVERMSFLASQKDGWFVPASELLDRLLVMKDVSVVNAKKWCIIENYNGEGIEGLTLLVRSKEALFDIKGNTYKADEKGRIILRRLEGRSAVVLHKDDVHVGDVRAHLGSLEELRVVTERGFMFFKHAWIRARLRNSRRWATT